MKRTELKRKTPLRSSSLTLSELRAERGAPLKRSSLKRGTSTLKRSPLKAVNPERMKRRMKEYRARLAKADWQLLRRQAFDRDMGLCWCPLCAEGRKYGEAFAFEPIEIWFDQKGKAHGFHTHHVTYTRFGNELLEDLLTMRPDHHQALESQRGYRRRFLLTEMK